MQKEKKGITGVNNLRLEEISFDTYQAWFEENYSSLNNRSPFHHPSWFKCVSKGINFGIYVIGVFSGNELVATLPGFLTRRGPLKLFGSPLPGAMTSYLGPVGMLDFQNRKFLSQLYTDENLIEFSMIENDVKKIFNLDYSNCPGLLERPRVEQSGINKIVKNFCFANIK